MSGLALEVNVVTATLQMGKLRLKDIKYCISWVISGGTKTETWVSSTQEFHSESLSGGIDSDSSFFDFCG